jgi:2-succinyl-5-enolpyruvyl-6-hydroxy-3-cyclohexene-1-carboxylate synthase
VRWFAAPEVPDDARAATWRPLAARAFAEATGKRPGPVHLNLSFRDPLVGLPGTLPDGRAHNRPWLERSRFSEPAETEVGRAAALLGGRRGVIIAGGGEIEAAELYTLATKLGWPVVVSPRSNGVWDAQPSTIVHLDALVRVPAFAERHRPEVVLQLGGLLTSRLVAEWLAGVPVVAAMADHEWIDPGAQVVLAVPLHLYEPLSEREWRAAPEDWLQGWTDAERAASAAIDATLAAHPEPTEPAIARDVVRHLPDQSALVVSSSMPVRDVEWYAEPGAALIEVFANRGANGIDGVVSTGVGVALTAGSAGPYSITVSAGGTDVMTAGGTDVALPRPSGPRYPTAVLVGDVAFLHDSTALVGLAARGVNLTIIVIDNDGGGIFSFLPQGTQLPAEQFEQLFGTPHGVDLTKLAEAHGIPCEVLETQAEVGPAVAACQGQEGPRILIVRTDRAANVAVHAEIHAAVAAALDRP